MTLDELAVFYREHLTRVILPFWLDRGIDRTHGGFYTCFENSGARLRSTDKYTWSQGRFLWVVSRLWREFSAILDPAALAECQRAATRGAEFLRRHAIDPDGRVRWVIDAEGRPLEMDRFGNAAAPGQAGVESITADLFLIYGLAEYARASGQRGCLDLAGRLFASVEARIASGDYRWAPHQGNPKGYRLHGVPMIMLETAQELALAWERFDHEEAGHFVAAGRDSLDRILGHFLIEGRILEMVPDEGAIPGAGLYAAHKKGGSATRKGAAASDDLLSSYINPGHCLEDSWFMLHFARRWGDSTVIPRVLDVIRYVMTTGWDIERGGLLLYAHAQGGPPHGTVRPENETDGIVASLADDWGQKLWWVHAEALYALLLAYEVSGDPWFLEQHGRVHDYVFGLFPNPDRSIGEWIQIRDRSGAPLDRVVALPVKDPMHVSRALMNIVTCLERQSRR